jgi:hypothetical protein
MALLNRCMVHLNPYTEHLAVDLTDLLGSLHHPLLRILLMMGGNLFQELLRNPMMSLATVMECLNRRIMVTYLVQNMEGHHRPFPRVNMDLLTDMPTTLTMEMEEASLRDRLKFRSMEIPRLVAVLLPLETIIILTMETTVLHLFHRLRVIPMALLPYRSSRASVSIFPNQSHL